jgi:hypothetical protein
MWEEQGVTLDGLSAGVEGLRNAYLPKNLGTTN